MRIEAVTLRRVSMPLRFVFTTSFDSVDHRDAIIVTVHGGGHEGYGECVTDRAPTYLSETNDTALHVLKDHILPAVLPHDFPNVESLWRAMAFVRGHNMAKAALENAWLDLYARQKQRPLCELLGGVTQRTAVGVSLGIQDSVQQTVDLTAEHVALGYQRIKLKIRPGWDIEPVAAVRQRFPHTDLTVDANSAYQPADVAVLKRLDAFDLDYIEQPLAHDDLHDHARLQRLLSTSICLDESILTPADARKALELGACRVINIKLGRVGGHLQARRIHDVALAFGAPVWCGGMLETGVGRAHNIALSTLENFTRPGDVSSARRYWLEDIVTPELHAEDGWMPVPPGPGIGVRLRADVVDRVTTWEETVTI